MNTEVNACTYVCNPADTERRNMLITAYRCSRHNGGNALLPEGNFKLFQTSIVTTLFQGFWVEQTLYGNLVLVLTPVHRLIHATQKAVIDYYMRLLNLSTFQLAKVNMLRIKAGLSQI